MQPGGETSVKVLISDFDGTMTQHDFYRLAIDCLIPADTPDHWAAYRAGTITHFEALRRYFAAIRAPLADVLTVVHRMQPDPALSSAVHSLQQAGWRIVVASAGCDWYIRQLLQEAGLTVELHANAGHFVDGQGLLMERPAATPFPSAALGIDKAGIVRHWLAAGATVAFAGDGLPDADPARLVSAELRFARADLATVLQREGLPFHSFRVWSDIARTLLSPSL